MALSKEGLALIKHHEGFSATTYLDVAGYPTIGYGHLIRPSETSLEGARLSEEEAEALLLRDVASAERSVLKLITVPLKQNQYDALVSFTFNLGGGALQASTLRAKVNREDHDAVPEQFMRWVFAGGRKVKGLITRRQEEANLYAGRY